MNDGRRKFILYIGNKLSKHGFTPGVIETLGPLLEKEGYEVSYAGIYKNKILRLLEIVFKTLTTGKRVDYILIDTYSTSAFWFAYLTGRLAKLIGTKYIPLLHGGDLPARLKKSPGACRKLFGNSQTNVAVSGYLKYEFEKYGYRTVLIPNSIDISLYPFGKREKLLPNLLWVRSFHRIYNPLMAADVLAELKKKYPAATLCMVGPDKDGSMKSFSDYVEKKGIKDSAKITGKLSKEEWIQLSENYDIFINTTNYDNTPVSVIEAMALGLPVVSTDPGGIPYLLQDGHDALLVKPGDYIEMTGKIIHLMENQNLALKITLNAREKAESFDWNEIKKKWIRLFSNLNE